MTALQNFNPGYMDARIAHMADDVHPLNMTGEPVHACNSHISLADGRRAQLSSMGVVSYGEMWYRDYTVAYATSRDGKIALYFFDDRNKLAEIKDTPFTAENLEQIRVMIREINKVDDDPFEEVSPIEQTNEG
jgi:hypothetical protein